MPDYTQFYEAFHEFLLTKEVTLAHAMSQDGDMEASGDDYGVAYGHVHHIRQEFKKLFPKNAPGESQ